MTATKNHYEELEFDLPAALLAQLVELLDSMSAGELSEQSIGRISEEQGVYQLYHEDELVYVGKTDAEAGLNKRLSRHKSKISAREHLEPGDIKFKAVRVYVFTPFDLEAYLIQHYKTKGMNLRWQHSGFGANDPGRNRDKTNLKKGHFDLTYPINLSHVVELNECGKSSTVAAVLRNLKEILPYTLRFENAGGRSRKPHRDLESTSIQIRSRRDTVESFLEQIKQVLPYEWQITALPGYVILYRESARYPQALRIY